MMVKCGQVWQIKEYVRAERNLYFSYIFVTKVQEDKKHGDVVYFDILGPVPVFQGKSSHSFLTWLIVNCDLVNG